MAHKELQAVLEEGLLTLDELCRSAAVSADWVHRRVDEGLLPLPPTAAGGWRFDAVMLRRVRCMRQLEVDFDAVPELAALVADLQDEMARLRARLARAGLD